MDEPRYEYDNFKVDPPRVDDGWYLVKDGMTYRVDVPIKKMRFTKSVNILTGEVYYPSNADRIRDMTDEELAELFMQEYDGADSFTCPVPHPCPPEKEASCRECFLDWLKEETDHD